jgi:hypothetical protein
MRVSQFTPDDPLPLPFLPEQWFDYTPVVTAESGSLTTISSEQGRWTKLGLVIFFKAGFTVTTNGTGAGSLLVTLPAISASTGATQILNGRRVNGATIEACVVSVGLGASTCQIHKYDGTYPGGSGTGIAVTGFYQSATK